MELKLVLLITGSILGATLLFLKRESRPWLIVSVILLLLPTMNQIYENFLSEKQYEISRMVGKLAPEKPAERTDSVVVLAGTNYLGLIAEEFSGGCPFYPLSVFGWKIPLEVRMAKRGLSVSIEFYDAGGMLIGELVDNEWNINKDQIYDRNYTNLAVEIVDKYNIPVLQVELVNSNTLMFGGVFLIEGVTYIIGDKASVTIGGLPKSPEELRKWTNDAGLRRWFKYPSQKYRGVRAET